MIAMILFNFDYLFKEEELESVVECCNKRCTKEYQFRDGFLLIEEEGAFYHFHSIKCLTTCAGVEGEC